MYMVQANVAMIVNYDCNVFIVEAAEIKVEECVKSTKSGDVITV
jgi:hypothetical protein